MNGAMTQPASYAMNDQQLLRYARHLLLDNVGVEGQNQILGAHALVIGAGGLGSPVALYLASAGVGHLTLVDHDRVDLTNLQRQIAHTTDRVGMLKVDSAKEAIRQINPDIVVTTHPVRVDAAWLQSHIADCDVVIDCTDNFTTRQMINLACVEARKPLVFGAAIQLAGQLSVFDTRRADSPCYACVFPPSEAPEEVSCATMGVFAPLVGIVGSLQASEALQVLLGQSRLIGHLLMVQAQGSECDRLRLKRNPTCSVCASHRAAL